MAGYDLIYCVPNSQRKNTVKWLRYIQRTAKEFEYTYCNFSTKMKEHNTIEVYVVLNGSIPILQHLSRQLPSMAKNFLSVSGLGNQFTRKVLIPHLENDEKGISVITKQYFKVSNIIGIQVDPVAISNKMKKEGWGKRRYSRKNAAINGILSTFHLWLQGVMANNYALIIFDQALEDWLKSILKYPINSASGLREVVSDAKSKNYITPYEGYRIIRFHRARNGVQHRGGRIRNETVYSMASFLFRLIDKYFEGVNNTIQK